MIWLIFAVVASFFNALWTSLTKKKSKNLSSMQFTILFRFMTAFILLPYFIIKFKSSYINYNFLFLACLYAIIEGLRTAVIVKGAEKDYYSTYAFVNTSPIITLILVPFFIKIEIINIWLIAGVIMIISGAFMFYKIGRVSVWCILASVLSGIGSIVAKNGVKASDGISFAVISFFALVINFGIIEYIKLKNEFFEKIKKEWKTVLKPAFFSAIATAFYFIALETGPITKVSSIMRMNLIFGFLLSYFVLKEKENFLMKMFGGICILIGGVLVYLA